MRLVRVAAGAPELADYADLTDVALRSRREPVEGLYMAEGAKVLARALAAGHTPRSVLVDERRVAEVAELLGDRDVAVYAAGQDVLRAVTGFRVHRGVLAAMHRPRLPSAESVAAAATRILVLEDLVDHTNVGAAFRSAAALGFDGVLVSPRCADPLYRRSVKVSMGAVLSLPWAVAEPWPQALRQLGERFELLALTPSPTALDIAAVAAAPPERIALLVGSEGPGLSAGVLRLARPVSIPMHHGIDSLNVAAAAAVACWALRRQPVLGGAGRAARSPRVPGSRAADRLPPSGGADPGARQAPAVPGTEES